MNTTAVIIPVLGTVLVAAMTVAVGWLTRKNDRAAERTDQAAKLTEVNLSNLSEHLEIIDALKHDVWDWEAWGNGIGREWEALQSELAEKGVIREIHELEPFPVSRFRRVTRRQQRRMESDS